MTCIIIFGICIFGSIGIIFLLNAFGIPDLGLIRDVLDGSDCCHFE